MVDRDCLLRGVANMICSVERHHPLRVAVDGIDAAGKTMFADELSPIIEKIGRPVIRASIDGFHNPREIRHQRGRMNPEGYYIDSFDYRALLDNLLLPLGPEGNMSYREAVYDYRKDEKLDTQWKNAPTNSILLFDGVFLMRPELVSLWDIRVFLDITYAESMNRGLQRDMGYSREIEDLYMERYIPGQKLYMIHSSPKKKSDLTIDNNDPMNPQITYITPDL
ncbi:MAG: uridine kinase [Candidatus Bathyarchaeota archaeon]|nr:uridine kinase [Candidatus Bathyarchaeota archaeon]